MSGRVWKVGDDIDTDALAPGKYMKCDIDEIARHCLEDVLPGFAAAVRPGDVLVAGRNFGIGSSREQAPEALRRLGIAAVVAPSFAGLFYRNALNLGLAVLVCEGAAAIPDGVRVAVDPAAGRIDGPGIALSCQPIPPFLLQMLAAGGLMPHLAQRLANEPQLGKRR
ncbi:3-isopropylmalate dehydratase [Massilia oculi]|uniref:3-isopropylmalate dehydratase small subunit n=1 Tax=Massilia hydrophila TaxID=3044279 RepID=A0ABS7YCF5_9BURK|nr:3-isopropylmalate dehydratase [Massilia oculi]MCA1857371.1 3-isopropylmalate dehydratase [Massilia oculi]